MKFDQRASAENAVLLRVIPKTKALKIHNSSWREKVAVVYKTYISRTRF